RWRTVRYRADRDSGVPERSQHGAPDRGMAGRCGPEHIACGEAGSEQRPQPAILSGWEATRVTLAWQHGTRHLDLRHRTEYSDSAYLHLKGHHRDDFDAGWKAPGVWLGIVAVRIMVGPRRWLGGTTAAAGGQ